MVIVRINGGLGNQIFQYASAKSHSLKYNVEYRFETSSYNNDVLRNFELSKFPNIKYKILEQVDLNRSFKQINDNYIYNVFPNDNIFLNGYWQSEKYFKEHKSIICDELSMSSDFRKNIIDKYPDIEESLSIHIRRSDYVHQEQHHPLQTLQYYKDSYDNINDDNIKVKIFSDDISWCKDNIKFNNVTYVEGQDNLSDLYTMSLCKHNIIANSSFSWWGAYLNKNSNKLVIGPSRWFGPNLPLNTKDIIPESWITI